MFSTVLACGIRLFQGKRAELIAYADELVNAFRPEIFEGSARYFAIKLYQRLALIYLPPRLADWRYKCGYRSLETNLAVRREQHDGDDNDDDNAKRKSAATAAAGDAKIGERQIEVKNNDETTASDEKVVAMAQVFLRALKDVDENEVRRVAAKALGRVCARISRAGSAVLIERVLNENFDDAAAAPLWHGGSLALAELTTRGCLLPTQLGARVVPLIATALLYDRQCNGVRESDGLKVHFI